MNALQHTSIRTSYRNSLSIVTSKHTTLLKKLQNKKEKIAVVGLDTNGLPIAINLAGRFSVIGYDANQRDVMRILRHEDPNAQIARASFRGKDTFFTTNEDYLAKAKVIIVSLNLTSEKANATNMRPIKITLASIGSKLKKGTIVYFANETSQNMLSNICIPMLTEISGLTYGKDFSIVVKDETKKLIGTNSASKHLIQTVFDTVQNQIN